MKTTIASIILGIALLFTTVVQADNAKQDALHDLHMIMRFLDHGLSVALEGADLQMLGEMGQSEKLDRDSIVYGSIMIKDGKALIKEMLDGKAMTEIYKEGNFDKKFMDDLHTLGEKMLEVIERVEKLHKNALKQASGK